MTRRTAVVLGTCLLLGVAGCGRGSPDTLEAGGSTFAYPMMSKWSGVYEKDKGVEVRYLSVGSGKGIEMMIGKTVDFGCSDAPLDEQDLEKARAAGGDVIHIPLVLGAVVPAYNLPEVKEPLRFTGQVLAEIFLGKIRRWDDPALKHLNPKASLPGREITVVRRLDGSGTTYIWTEYLAKVNPQWKDRVGVGRTVHWPTGEAARGNEGVAGFITRTPGAIGYLELTYGLQESIAFGSVQNRDGEFVRATPEAVTAAARAALTTVPEDLRFSINNARGAKSYPVSGACWAVAYARQPAGKGKRVVEFLRWATHEGQQYAEEMGYARLPEAVVSRLEARLDLIREGP